MPARRRRGITHIFLVFTGVRELKVRQVIHNIILVGDFRNHGYFMISVLSDIK